MMRDDMTDIEWLRARLARAQQHSEALTDDIAVQDGLRLTGTVMRLDRIRETLDDCWRTLQQVYDEARERDRILGDNGTVGEPSGGGSGVVADVLCAAAAGVRQAGGDLHRRAGGSADVAV